MGRGGNLSNKWGLWQHVMIITLDRRQSKMQLYQLTNVDQKSIEAVFNDCHLLSVWPQMAIKKLCF